MQDIVLTFRTVRHSRPVRAEELVDITVFLRRRNEDGGTIHIPHFSALPATVFARVPASLANCLPTSIQQNSLPLLSKQTICVRVSTAYYVTGKSCCTATMRCRGCGACLAASIKRHWISNMSRFRYAGRPGMIRKNTAMKADKAVHRTEWCRRHLFSTMQELSVRL